MTRISLTTIVVAFLMLSFLGSAAAEESARIVLLDVDNGVPDADEVAEILRGHLEPVDVWVDIVESDRLPEDEATWIEFAEEVAGDKPGTVALFGWKCEQQNECRLFVVETVRFSVLGIPVIPRQTDEVSFALAATAREALLGGLFGEIDRLTTEGERPTEPQPLGPRIPKPHSDSGDSGGLAAASRPWMWLEAGYQGDYPYPGGGPLHGPVLGLALAPGKNVVPAISVGWLGIREEENDFGVARSHRFPISAAIRVAFPIGPALFSIAPMARLDIVMVETSPHGPRDNSADTEVEFNVGGMTSWNLPLPVNNLEIVIGAGVLATAIGHDYKVEGATTIPASSFRIIWSVGLAWSPLG